MPPSIYPKIWGKIRYTSHNFRASLTAQSVNNRLQCRRHWMDSWVRKIPWRRKQLPTPVFLGFPCDSAGQESACNAGDLGSIPGLGRSPGKEKGYPLQYSGLENSMACIAHGVTKSQTQLSNFHFQATKKGLGDLCTFPHWDISQPLSDTAGKLRPAHWTKLSILIWQPNAKVDLLVTTSQRKANSGVVLWNYKRIVCYNGQNYRLMASNWPRKQLTTNSKRQKRHCF